MNRKLLLIAIVATLFSSLKSTGQLANLTILTPNDTTVCGPINLRATAVVTPAIVSNPVDDDYAPVTTPIGFSFKFYGNTYTRCLVSSNGYLSFNLADSGAYSPWSLVSAGNIPGNTACVNSICGVYEDIYLVTGGVIKTYTVGTAPNRKFVCNFCDCPMYYPTTCTDHVTFQIILYETSNNIEVHIYHKTYCTSWNGGLAIEGVQDPTGTVGTPVPGRNNTQWTAFNDAYQFVPVGTTSYNVAPIPFAPIPDSTTGLYSWYQGTTFLGNGITVGSINTINVTPSGPTTYTCLFPAFNCGNNDTVGSSVNILMSQVTVRDIVTQPTTCGDCNGQIEIIGLLPNSIDTIMTKKNGLWQTGVVATTGIDSTAYLSNLCYGTYDSTYVKSACPSNYLNTVVLTNPPMSVVYSDQINFGCTADTVIFTNSSTAPGAEVINYLWTFGDGTTDTNANPIHIFTTQGIYNVKLFMTNIFCMDSISVPGANLRHPLKAGFTIPKYVYCQGENVTFTNTTIDTTRLGIAPSFAWSFGDEGTSSSIAPTYAYNFNDTGSYTITMVVQDFVPCYDTARATVNIITKPKHYSYDTTLCNPNTTVLVGKSISNADTYDWSTGQSGTFIIPNATGIYTVNTTNICGSVEDSVFVNIVDCDQFLVGSNLHTPGTKCYDLVDSAGTATYKTVPCPICFFMPTAFTPNGDGRNDYFHVRANCAIRTYGIKIFNRYGQLVYANYYFDEGWDGNFNGTPADIGTYFYEIKYTPDYANAHEITLSGDVTLVR